MCPALRLVALDMRQCESSYCISACDVSLERIQTAGLSALRKGSRSSRLPLSRGVAGLMSNARASRKASRALGSLVVAHENVERRKQFDEVVAAMKLNPEKIKTLSVVSQTTDHNNSP